MSSGSRVGTLERLVFEHRGAVVLACALATLALGAEAAARLEVRVDLEGMLPAGQPIVRNYLENRSELRGLGDSLHVVVESRRGDVYDPAYLEALRRIGDELVHMPGVDRAWVRSLWMPGVRWSEVTEEGYRGGPVMPDDFDGTPPSIEALRRNVRRAGLAGGLVAGDGRSSAVFLPLLDRDPLTGRALDRLALSARVEELRARFDGAGDGPVALHVVGFAQLAADLDAGMRQVSAWCAAAALIATGLILAHTRCVRSTALIASCSLVAVIWQAGLVSALGLALDPFSVLVPFLIFAMGLSHGAQKMNGVLQDVGRGADPLTAARRTFLRLFGTGLTAILTDVAGFAALAAIDIPVIRRLSVTAGLGAAALVVTDLVLLPVLLSFSGVSRAAAARAARTEAGDGDGRALRLLEGITRRAPATAVLCAAAVVVAAGLWASRGLAVGDVGSGAPELRPASRYNRDEAYVAEHYDRASDRLAVIVRTAADGCADHRTLVEADRLAWALRQVPGVRATASLPDAVREITAGAFEGSPKWLTLSRQQEVLNNAVQTALTRSPELLNADCSVTPVIAYLSDHRAATLDRVVRAASGFAERHGGEGRSFLLAAGNAGFQAATNLAVRQAGWAMTAGVYGAVALLCWLAFRSWRAVLVTLVPLAATSVLCAALMVALGIGVKVATLPVIALGVGIPDHALYLLSVQLAHQRAGLSLAEAHRRSLRFTGSAVALVSLTLASGVGAWAFSPVRMQADMGLLLSFMFLGSGAGALVLVPAMSRFLLQGVRGQEVRP